MTGIKYGMQEQNKTNQSVLTIEQQKRISMTGVESVDSFSNTAIRLTVCGKKVLIGGTQLKILSFSKGSGAFAASGEIISIKYGGAKGKSLSKLFK